MLGRKRRKSKPGKTKEREREGKDQSGGFPLKDLSWQAMLKMGKNDAFRFSSQKKMGLACFLIRLYFQPWKKR